MNNQTFFQHYIKLKTTHNEYEVENWQELYDQFYNVLKETEAFSLVTTESYSYMIESNGCVTYEFFTVFDGKVSKEEAKSIINSTIQTEFTLTDKSGVVHNITTDLNNKEYTVLQTIPSSKLTFAQIENTSMLQNESDLPEGTRFIGIQGVLGEKASDPTLIHIVFYDENKNPLMFESESPDWIKSFKDKFQDTFTVRDQMFIEYKYVAKLLTGEMKYSFDFFGKKISFENERPFTKKEPTEKQLLNHNIIMMYLEPTKEYFY